MEDPKSTFRPTAAPQPWDILQFDCSSNGSMPVQKSDATGRFQFSFMFRGQENWLSRFASMQDINEQRDDVKQEVTALLARWLKMQNVCLLMGAGASYYVTGFLGMGLFDRVKSLLAGRESASTLATLIELASDPDSVGRDFEKFLSQLSAWRALLNSSDWPLDKMSLPVPLKGVRGQAQKRKRIEDLLLDLERAVAVVCNVELPASALSQMPVRADSIITNVSPHEAFAAKLVARDPHEGRTKIFTTNYDTLIEQALDRLGILCIDGFVGTVARHFNPACYDLDFYYPGEITEGRVRRYDKVIHLYKIHGSINWRKRRNQAVINPYGIVCDGNNLPTQDEILSSLKKRTKIHNLSEIFAAEESLAILPTAGKYGETLAMPYAHLFRSFGAALREPQTVLIVLGYSGWDAHINQIVHEALANPGFCCVMVDPSPSEWARGLCRADAAGRVYCIGGEWAKFEFFAKMVLPDLEVLTTELSVARTLRDLQKGRKDIQVPMSESASETQDV